MAKESTAIELAFADELEKNADPLLTALAAVKAYPWLLAAPFALPLVPTALQLGAMGAKLTGKAVAAPFRIAGHIRRKRQLNRIEEAQRRIEEAQQKMHQGTGKAFRRAKTTSKDVMKKLRTLARFA